MSVHLLPGQVLGRAGGGLEPANASWAANADVARIGRAGELATAQVLDRWALRPGGPSVLHDLTVPGSRGNVDHLVVSGTRLLLVDSKVWKPSLYWSIGGRVFRGARPFKFGYSEKWNMSLAADRLVRYLAERGVHAQAATPWTVVWSSSQRAPVRCALLRLPGARAVSGPRLERRRPVSGNADPRIVAALSALCSTARPQAALPSPRRGGAHEHPW